MNKTLPLKNIEILLETTKKAVESPKHLPKIVTFSGPSGFGKSFACAYVANKYNCSYVEIGASWGVSHLLDEILASLGITTKEKTIARKMKVVVESLITANRPLILDEFDHMVKPRCLEIIREIHDKALTPIILVGEELLPKKLEETERFHNRVLNWAYAEPASLQDAEYLARFYCKGLDVKEDLLEKLVKASQGRVRRLCVNLEQIKQEARLNNWKQIDLKAWGERKLFTGSAPAPRRLGR